MKGKKNYPGNDGALKLKNPYKALLSYEEDDQKIFCGRDLEKKQLFKLVKFNVLTVVFGKSGIGKSSLLNAGLTPQLRKYDFLPIRLRLNYSSESELGLMEQVRESIQKVIEKPFDPTESLWEYFHRVKHVDESGNNTITPVLILDQFEEAFNFKKNHIQFDWLIDELYYLIEDQIPDSLKDRILKEEERFPYQDARPNVRIIISLREDYLPHLNALRSRIPSILRVMFQVSHLNETQARQIFGMPGGIQNKELVNDILCLFVQGETRDDKTIPDEKLEIEPSILSMLCYQLVEKCISKGIGDKDKEIILVDFYKSVLRKFPKKLEIFIESKLLTDGGSRTPFFLEPDHPLGELFDQLIKERILRKVYYGDKEYIEIIHDVLAPIIKENRDIRSRRKKNFIIGVLAGLLIIFIALTMFAFYQTNRVNKQYKKILATSIADKAMNIIRNDNVKAIRMAEAAYELSFPPPPTVMQSLSAAFYSTDRTPFYNVVMKHSHWIASAVFSPDGNYILTASGDNTAKLWDLKGNLVNNFPHADQVQTAVFSRDGKNILTTSTDNTSRLWNREEKQVTTYMHNSPVRTAVFSPDGHYILTASGDNTVKLWDWKGKQTAIYKHKNSVLTAVFSRDGNYILTASKDNTAKLWDRKGKNLATFKHNSWIHSAVFSPDNMHILTASNDNTAKLWDWNEKQLATFKHDAHVRTAVFSLDGKYILTASHDKTARLWKLTGKLVTKLEHNGWVYSAVFSMDGDLILTASGDNTAKLWDRKGKQVAIFKHNAQILTAKFSPDGSRILTASKDKTAKLWDLHEKQLAQFKHNDDVHFAIFSPNGNRILTASKDSTAKLWDLKGNLLANLNQHTKSVNFAMFSPDGMWIITASDDGTAKLWYTPEAIIKWLKTAKIPGLTSDEKKELGLK
jgi:WD40 repeat protein